MRTQVSGVTAEELAERYPVLFHLAYGGAWPCILRYGLLSTEALLDVLGVQGERRHQLLSGLRHESVSLEGLDCGKVVIRDHAMNEAQLARVLRGITPREWYELLNRYVFLWPTEDRLSRMHKKYEGEPQTILRLDTRALLDRHSSRVLLSPYNSGSTVYKPVERGRETFQPLASYPYQQRRRAVAEILIEGGIPDVEDFVLDVTDANKGSRKVIWSRGSRGARS